MAERLLDQVRWFAKRGDALPEWREAARVRDADELWRLWPGLPVVTRADLRGRFNPIEIRRRFGVEGEASRTGGSTGEPTPYLHDRAMLGATTAARLFARRRMGWRPGMATVCVWGSERDIGRSSPLRQRVSSWLRQDLLIDGYHLGPETVDRLERAAAGCREFALYGFSSMLEFVAEEVVRRGGIPGRVAAAWNGGEVLYDRQSEVFRRAFGMGILNLYGGRELSAMAYQPRGGAPLRVLRPLLMVEIVDERGRPVAPGEPGRLLWTSTVCRGTPFLRYEIGDIGSAPSEGVDEDGIGELRPVEGRVAGLLELAGGKTISCLYWNHLLKEFGEIEQFQVVLRRERDLELRLKGRPLMEERERELRGALGLMLGDVPVAIRWMETIPRTAQGKLMQVIREP